MIWALLGAFVVGGLFGAVGACVALVLYSAAGPD